MVCTLTLENIILEVLQQQTMLMPKKLRQAHVYK